MLMMRKFLSVIISLGTIYAFAQTSQKTAAQPAVPPAITDPHQITSKSKLDVQPLSIEKLYLTHSVGDSTWSPDGKQVAFISNISGRRNLWLVPAESGWPEQLTVSDQRQETPAWSPTGRWIAYGSDKDGNEQWDIFLVSPSNGQVINLTNTPEISEEGFAWSPDGEKLVYSVKPKEATNYEIDVIEVLTKKITHLTSGTPHQLSNLGAIWSKDGKSIVYTQMDAAGKNSNIFVADSSTGKATNLTPHKDEQTFSATGISPDGKTLLITSNAENGYDNAALLEVATKKITWLTNEKWQIASGSFSPDGKSVTWTENKDGNISIFMYDLSPRTAHPLPLGAGLNATVGVPSLSNASNRIGAAIVMPDNPGTGAPSGRPTQTPITVLPSNPIDHPSRYPYDVPVLKAILPADPFSGGGTSRRISVTYQAAVGSSTGAVGPSSVTGGTAPSLRCTSVPPRAIAA